MSLVNISLNARIHCQDNHPATLHRIVLNPMTYRITALVVRQGILRKRMRVVPSSMVKPVASEGFCLAITGAELLSYPEYREYDREIPTLDFEEDRIHSHVDVRVWLTNYDFNKERRSIVPATRHCVCEGISTHLRALGRNSRIQNASGYVGKLDHVLADSESWQLLQLTIRRGILSQKLIIPTSWLKSVDNASIFIRGSHRQLQELHTFRAHPDAQILLKLQEWFDEAPFDFSDVVPTVEEGVLHLHGVVENDAARRHAEMIGRSIAGVLVVENRLETSQVVTDQVAVLLRGDDQIEATPPRAHV
jgi:hypothetical protein